MTDAKTIRERCARCGAPFECRSFDIKSCHCSKVELTPERQAKLAENYKGCLCAACLQDVIASKDTF